MQIREERLSKLLLDEIAESDSRWKMIEDENAELLLEISDLVFEHLVDETLLVLSKQGARQPHAGSSQ